MRLLVPIAVFVLLAGGIVAAAVIVPAAGDGESQPAASRSCVPALERGVLPEWARAGFSEPRPRLPHAIGRSGEIAALIFGHPLTAPPRARRSNKILWVARVPAEPGTDLRIRARRMRGDNAVGQPLDRRVRGGPGPSIVNLPAPGCWRLRLSWSGRSDELDLAYAARG